MDAPSVALVGAGQMGAALIRGWINAIRRGGGLTLSVLEPEFDPDLELELISSGAVLNPPELERVDVVVLAVKPQQFAAAAGGVRPLTEGGAMVLSIMAGVTIETLAELLRARRIVRAMPNTPGQIGQGVTAMVASAACDGADLALARLLLEPLGLIEPLPSERLMDVVTAVAGSGPAYAFLLAEALAAAAENEGLEREAAIRIARQTIAGAGALLLASDQTLAGLRKQVTSPGGATEAALDVLQSPEGLLPLLRRAVTAATHRSRELGKGVRG
ncbi:MAG: pyrroline-5-carboxylate reductase [Hyphomonadaceae bacterium]|nr:pyrroline-5-carboxylate reductase [Hyphomonadaceae bacterium]